MTLEERFWSKVNKDGPTIREDIGPCWVWVSEKLPEPNGYGVFRTFNAGRTVRHRAHRVSWAMTHGSITSDVWILHRCDNRLCVNPAHLMPGDNAANVADKVAKGRQSRAGGQGHFTHCKNGHPYTEGNIRTSHKGYRQCLRCLRATRAEQDRKAVAKRRLTREAKLDAVKP